MDPYSSGWQPYYRWYAMKRFRCLRPSFAPQIDARDRGNGAAASRLSTFLGERILANVAAPPTRVMNSRRLPRNSIQKIPVESDPVSSMRVRAAHGNSFDKWRHLG
jgi:hypothetical protein